MRLAFEATRNGARDESGHATHVLHSRPRTRADILHSRPRPHVTSAPNEQALEAELSIQHQNKVRVGAAIYTTLCAAGVVGWLAVFWPSNGVQVQWFGSVALGWVWIIGGAVLLLGGALGFGARFVHAGRDIAQARQSLADFPTATARRS
jgi:hypothetical protein